MRDSWACTAFLFEEGSLATSFSLFMGYYSEDWMHLGGALEHFGRGRGRNQRTNCVLRALFHPYQKQEQKTDFISNYSIAKLCISEKKYV